MIHTRHFHFDWQISLIGLSALAGLLITYNRASAVYQLAIIILGIVLYFFASSVPDPVLLRRRQRSLLSGLLIILPLIIAVYFFMTNDWALWLGKVPALNLFLRILRRWPLSSIGIGLNPNVVGGALAALLPLQIFALRTTSRWISIPLIALTVIALILSQTRGAWLSLLLVVGMWQLWRAIAARSRNERTARWLWLGIVIILGASLVFVLFGVTSWGDRLLSLGGDRVNIWRNSIDLIGDYPLTGLGLAGFEMAYSTYVLLLHVGHTMHAHNLWLDMWLNQGLLGFVALAGMVLNAIWPRASSRWQTSALLALGVMLVHSMVDDPYYGYGGVGLFLLFIPLGLLARPSEVNMAVSHVGRQRFQPAWLIWGPALICILVGLVIPSGRAVWEANLGALQQTQAELSTYHWPDVPLQDVLRRSGSDGIEIAAQHYYNSLALDPANAVANRRLGQIELARNQYDSACRRLAAAFAANPDQQATRQLLGECAALNADDAQAVALWRTVTMEDSQLDLRMWWYQDYLNDQTRTERMRQAISQLRHNDPDL